MIGNRAMKFTTQKTLLTIAITAVILAGCGGGGSKSSPGVTTPPIDTGTDTGIEPAVVDVNTTVSSVKAGVLDSGVVKDAVNLKGSVSDVKKYKYDNASGKLVITDLNDASADNQDISSTKHGTFVATVLAGNTKNGSTKGVANGVADIFAAQVSDDSTGTASTASIFGAIEHLNANNGVNLFNISMGGFWEEVADPVNYFSLNYAPAKAAVDNGALLVFSTGNDGALEASSSATMPVYDTSLEKGWLAVAGLNEDHTGLYEYNNTWGGSNICGSAARWCLSADYVNTGVGNSALGNGLYNMYGTSGSAPQVTGTAALVWSNYSWMTADQVRQAILTTADYMEDDSTNNGLYNETYGWGYLNTDKAVKGVGKFSSVFGDFNANVTTGLVGVFSNDISGDAGLIKSGAGRLVLSGDNSYTGDTIVNAGVLKIAGDTSSSDFTVNANGTLLAGTGKVGSVSNSGNVSTEEGTLTIEGDYTQSSTGTLTYKVGKGVDVTGSASLAGSLNVTATDAKYVATGKHTVLNADDGVTGTFSDVYTNKAFLKINGVTYDAENVYADVSLQSTATKATSQGGVTAVASDLTDQLLAKADTQYLAGETDTSLVAYATALQSVATNADVQAILNSNSGSVFAETPSVLLKNQNVATGVVAKHINNVANGNSGVWAETTLLSTKNGATGWDSVDSDVYSASVGADFNITSNTILGGYVSTLKDSSDYSLNSNEANTDTTGLGVYAKYDLGAPYFTGLAYYGSGDVEYKRNITDGVTSAKTETKSDVSIFNAYGEFGYGFSNDLVEITPFVALAYADASIDGLSENSDIGLTVSDADAKETSLHTGLRVSSEIAQGFNLGGFVQYSKVLDRDLSDVTVVSNVDTDVSVSFAPPSFDKDYFMYGASGKYTNNAWTFFVNAAAISDDDTGYQGQIGFKYAFD